MSSLKSRILGESIMNNRNRDMIESKRPDPDGPVRISKIVRMEEANQYRQQMMDEQQKQLSRRALIDRMMKTGENTLMVDSDDDPSTVTVTCSVSQCIHNLEGYCSTNPVIEMSEIDRGISADSTLCATFQPAITSQAKEAAYEDDDDEYSDEQTEELDESQEDTDED